jgi:hypothetical protein
MKGHCIECGKKLHGKRQAQCDNFTCSACCDKQHAAWLKTKDGKQHTEAMIFIRTHD